MTKERTVTFDSRALVIDGKRQLLISGSLHFPRSTPEKWPQILKELKDFGANMVEIYDFWGSHEPAENDYDFSGRLDIIHFLQDVQQAGLYAFLQIGPFVNAEWNYGGIPTWLKFVKGVSLRTYNFQFMSSMDKWVRHLVALLKQNNMFYPQGGPIVAAQIENDYGNVEKEYGEEGKKYLAWCVELAKSLDIGVPWTMSTQEDAPPEIINTCGGYYCDYWIATHKKKFSDQPSWWVCNLIGGAQKWGAPRPIRMAQEIAFAVLRCTPMVGQ